MNRAQSGVGTRGPGRQEPALLSRSPQTCKEAVTVPRWAPRCILTADGGACGCTCGREGHSVGPEKQGPRPPPPTAGVGSRAGEKGTPVTGLSEPSLTHRTRDMCHCGPEREGHC